MPKFRLFFLALPLLVLLSAPATRAIEVSEVTVDFPLSEVLEIKETEKETSSEVGQTTGGAAAVWRAPWEDSWFSYRQNVLRGNFEAAQDKIDEVLRYKERAGIPNLFLPATALLVESTTARKQSRYDDALKLIDYSKSLAPDDPAPHFQRARTIWRQNQLRALASLDAVLEGLGTFFRDYRSFYPWGLSVAIWILLSLTAASFLTVFLFAPRVMPRMAHDLSHIIKVPQWLWYIGIPILLLAVLVMGMPFTHWTVLLALLMILHLTGRERVAVGLALLFMGSLPLLVHVLALGNVHYTDSRPLAIYLAERGGEGSRTLEQLHQLRVKDPGDSQTLAALSLVLKRSGRIREAESLLLQALEISPDQPSYINNLGNILMSAGRIESAIDHYRQALRYKDDPRIHYNLSQALRENLQLEEGESEFRKAQEMDPELTGSLMERQKEGARRITVDIYGDVSRFFIDSLTLPPDGRSWRNGFWASLVPVVPFSMSWLLYPLASLVLLAGAIPGSRLNLSRRCRKCNSMHCPKCSQSSSDILCAQCRQIFLVRSGVDPASRVKKMMQIMRFGKRRGLLSRVATILLPGMGHIYLGAGWQAFGLITVSVLFWTKWVMWFGLFRNTTMLEIQSGIVSKVLFGILLAAFYLLALRSVGRMMEEK